MSWLFSQALVAEYSAASCSAGAPSAPSNTTPTPQAFLWRDKTTDAWSRFPSGLTCELLKEDRGEELLTWFRAGFLAPTYQPQAKAQESPESSQDCGARWRALSVKFDRDTFSWKTAHCLLSEDLPWSLVTLPKWGMMRAGELWERTTSALRTSGIESGSLPTPMSSEHKYRKRGNSQQSRSLGALAATGAIHLWRSPAARDWKNARNPDKCNANGGGRQTGLNDQVCNKNGATSAERNGQLNPEFSEWLLGWPIGWTDSKPLGTDRWRAWLRSHGVCSEGRAMSEEAA
jgi:hypothetical protein